MYICFKNNQTIQPYLELLHNNPLQELPKVADDNKNNGYIRQVSRQTYHICPNNGHGFISQLIFQNKG